MKFTIQHATQTRHLNTRTWHGLGGALAAILLLPSFPVLAGTATHCLWRVGNATNHVYLAGSVHLLKKSHYPLPEAIEAAYADSDVLVLEADLSVAQDHEKQMAILKEGMLQGDATLKGALSRSTWTRAEKALAEMGMSIALFNAFKPWFFATTLTAMRLQTLGFSAMDGIDWHFFNRASAERKSIVGLETLDYQVSLFNAIASDDQDALVRQTLADIAHIEEEMDTILQAWSTGDLDAMDRLLLDSFKPYPHIQKLLVTDRNRNWMPRIIDFLQSGKVHMIVVGAGHLPGKQGLLNLLQKQGLKIEQL